MWLEGGGCRWSGCGTKPEVSLMGKMGDRQRRSEATVEKHCLELRVGGGAACVEAC